ncbi:hypothetical protein BKA67DRAFT_593294 [Truncatella angustata]|uniref:Uncharacterized protein n=1 Tax=Truncatella angustata TaxID=152316 RepID=A0A9P8UJH7_9PEZI|nr:uncharacterized protein BKA67DRAFT_593294 [Truncatella angustata]KAH6653337.1 hypothetical protein BKA67DRAFT_593294 [Truncatella angustata]KAH8196386.1 hypothetical protein TruAng_009436 [Truncatella angustata]
MSAAIGRGWNPASGWDSGDLPPGLSPAGVGGYVGIPGAPVATGPVSTMPFAGMNGPYGYQASSFPYSPGPPAAVGPVYTWPANGFQHPLPVFPNQPGGPRYPSPHPVVSSDAPALNFQNSTGGMGCEPGYNYYFPSEHTKIHVIKSRDPPWRLPAGMSMNFEAYHVPVIVTLECLMNGFGATNPVAKKNKITEVCEGGNNRWYKGMTWSADDEDEMKKTLKELGWDNSRSGRPHEKPVIWIWVTKD